MVGIEVKLWRFYAMLTGMILLCFLPAEPQLLPSQAKGAARQQVVMLSSQRGCAAGIIVGFDASNVYIATAAHITDLPAKQNQTVKVRFESTAPASSVGTFLPQFAIRGKGDLAVVSVRRTGVIDRFINGLDFAMLSPVPLGPLNTPVTSLGCSGGAWWSSGSDETLLMPDRGYLRFKTSATAGQSGGALYNDAWELIGMPLDEGDNGLYARPIAEILADLRRWGVPVRLSVRPLRNRARGADEIARENAAISKSRQLAAKASIQWPNSPQLGSLLSTQATRYSVTNEALVQLAQIWDRSIERTLYGVAPFRTVAFSKDGSLVAAGDLSGKVRLWRAETGALLHTIDSGGGFVSSVSFSPDGKTIAGASDDQVILWDIQTEARTVLRGHTDAVYSVAFSPNGRLLASASGDHTIVLWDLSTGLRMRTLQGHTAEVYDVAFSPDNTMLASASEDKRVILWNVESGERLRTMADPQGAAFCVAFSPNGKFVASGYGTASKPGGLTVTLTPQDHDVVVWSTSDGSRIATLSGHRNAVTSVSFRPDGEILASGSADKRLILWDTTQWQRRQTLTGHSDDINGVAFNSDGTLLASAGKDKEIILWDGSPNGGHLLLNGHAKPVTSLAFNHDGSILATGSEDSSVILWDVATRARLATLVGHTKTVNDLSFSPDQHTLASGGGDGKVILWDIRTGGRLMTLSAPAAVYRVAFSARRQLASGGLDNNVTLWNLDTQSPIRILPGSSDDVLGISFSPDGRRIAVVNRFSGVVVWNVDDGSRVKDLGAGRSTVAFSPDGRQLAASEGLRNADVLRWDAQDLTELPKLQSATRLEDIGGRTGIVYGLAFSSDGSRIASAYDLWDADDGTRLTTLERHRFVDAIAFSPDGKRIATNDQDSPAVVLWDLDLKSWQSRACRIAGRNFTLTEWKDFISAGPYVRTCPELPGPE